VGLQADKAGGYKPTKQDARLLQIETEKLNKANAVIYRARHCARLLKSQPQPFF
jgi:predicted transcriptional regulator